jgi:hypothetical protein
MDDYDFSESTKKLVDIATVYLKLETSFPASIEKIKGNKEAHDNHKQLVSLKNDIENLKLDPLEVICAFSEILIKLHKKEDIQDSIKYIEGLASDIRGYAQNYNKDLKKYKEDIEFSINELDRVENGLEDKVSEFSKLVNLIKKQNGF